MPSFQGRTVTSKLAQLNSMAAHELTHSARELPQLPNDPRQYTSKCLADDDMHDPSSLGRLRHEISMQRRYAKVFIQMLYCQGQPQDGLSKLNHYRLLDSKQRGFFIEDCDPELGRFVRSLKISFHLFMFGKGLESPKNTLAGSKMGSRYDTSQVGAGSVGRLMSPLKKFFASRNNLSLEMPAPEAVDPVIQDAGDERARKLLELIDWLGEVERLTLEWDPADDDNPIVVNWYWPLLLNAALESFGDNLRSLRLAVTMECWGQLLYPSLHFKRLEELSIEFKTAIADQNLITRTALIPFIHRHSTLNTLGIDSQNFNPSTFYREIGFLPNLRRLRIGEIMGYHHDRHGTPCQFLKLYSGVLTDVRWRLCGAVSVSPDPADVDIWFCEDEHETLQFLRLKNLKFKGLHCLPLPVYFPSVLDCVGAQHRTLTKLAINGWKLNEKPFYIFLDTIASPRLVQLEINLVKLTSRVFSAMEAKLPNLRILRLFYSSAWKQSEESCSDLDLSELCAEDYKEAVPYHPASAAKQFIQDIEPLKFPNWLIAKLSLQCSYPDPFAKDPEWRAWRVGKAIVESLPNLVTVNGMSRDVYIKCAEASPQRFPGYL